MNPTMDPIKDPTKDPTKTIGLRDPTRSEGFHKDKGCNQHVGEQVTSKVVEIWDKSNFIIISEPNVLIWLR